MPTTVTLDELLAAPLVVTAQEAVAVIAQLARAPQTGRPLAAPLDRIAQQARQIRQLRDRVQRDPAAQ